MSAEVLLPKSSDVSREYPRMLKIQGHSTFELTRAPMAVDPRQRFSRVSLLPLTYDVDNNSLDPIRLILISRPPLQRITVAC